MLSRNALAALLTLGALLLLTAPAQAVPPECDPELKLTAVESQSLQLWLGQPCLDIDTADLSYTVVTEPANGELLGPTPFDTIFYTPDDGFIGTDSFTYKASDGTDESGVVTVTIEVNENQPPECDTPTELKAEPDAPTPFETFFVCRDPDDEFAPLTFTVVDQPAHGEVTADGFFTPLTYTPDDGYRGPDSFTFKASDGLDDSNVATVEVTVLQPNRPPTCVTAATLTVAVGGTLLLDHRSACSDPDGDGLFPLLVTAPSHGTLAFASGGLVEYKPNIGFQGMDTITYRVQDDRGGLSNVATLHIRVGDPPQGSAKVPPKQPAKGPSQGPADTPADKTAPSVLIAGATGQRLRSVRRKGLALALDLSEPAAVEVKLLVGKRAARRLGIRRIVGSAVQALPSGRSTLTVKLKRKARKAFRRTRKVKLRVVLAATDAAGNRVEQARTLTLRR